jgi:hypothetical protein
MKPTLLIFTLLLGTGALAEAKCQIPVHRIEAVSATVKWMDENGAEDNAAVIRGDADVSSYNKENSYVGDYEAFLRPDKSDSYQLLPIPLFLMELDKETDSVYICAHKESAHPAKDEMVVYFLRHNKIKSMTPVPLPINLVGKVLWGPIENTPLMITKVPLTLLAKIQTLFNHAFSDLTRIGVDRVRLTDTQLELASGGDPSEFEHAVLHKTIKFK